MAPLSSGFNFTDAFVYLTVMIITGLEINFLVHLQSLASTIFSTSKVVRPLTNSFQMFGEMDDSNSQTFASGHFSHLQLIKITHILQVCEWKFRALHQCVHNFVGCNQITFLVTRNVALIKL